MDCHFRDLPDFQSSGERLMTNEWQIPKMTVHKKLLESSYLRARRALSLFKDVLLRARRALYHHRLCIAIAPFWFSTEHLWILIAALSLFNWWYLLRYQKDCCSLIYVLLVQRYHPVCVSQSEHVCVYVCVWVPCLCSQLTMSMCE